MMERTVNALLALFAAALICGVITVEGKVEAAWTINCGIGND